MAAAHPFQPVELEMALTKVAKHEPLTRSERHLVQRTLDAIPTVVEDGETRTYRAPPSPLMRSIGMTEDVVFEVGPCDLGDFPAEERAAIEQAMEEIRSGRAKLVPHEEVHRELEARVRRELGESAG